MATRRIIISGNEKETILLHTWKVEFVDGMMFVQSSSKAPGGQKKSKFRHEAGYLFLHNSTINAYSYFRTEKFQKMLDEFKIDSIKKADPNIRYTEKSVDWRHNGGSALREYVAETDGEINKIDDDYITYFTGRAFRDIEVKNASWVLFKIQDGSSFYYILYTEMPVRKAIAKIIDHRNK